MKYRRVLVKLSGAALAGEDTTRTFGRPAIEHITREMLSLAQNGVEVALIVGGGNIFRGNMADEWHIEKAEADNMGMLGTIINGVLLRATLLRAGAKVRLMTAVPMPSVAEPYIRLRAVRHLEKGRMIILVGGIGQPFVTTDYPAAQRAAEIGCQAVLAAKNGVDGIYDADPRKNPAAKRYRSIASDVAIRNNLKVMDQSALILARDHNLPVHVFDFDQVDAALRICKGEAVGTYVSPTAETAFYDE
ncbi:MAG: UMP kinase [Myxococcota bacterium]